jgi:hypothetical protein
MKEEVKRRDENMKKRDEENKKWKKK